jgi:hypothetical protein
MPRCCASSAPGWSRVAPRSGYSRSCSCAVGSLACSRCAAGNVLTRPTSWPRSGCSTGWSSWAKPCGPRSTSLPPSPPTGCAARPHALGTSATPGVLRTVAYRGPRPSARPTRALSARTGSRCSTGSTGREHPRACGRCPRSRCCGGFGHATSCATARHLPGAELCGSGPRRSCRRLGQGSSPLTTRRRATGPARVSPGPGTSCT